MSIFDLLLRIKFKYVISFICVITLYIFAFEKRYFQINSDWKILCHENSISLCEFELKVTNVNNSRTKNIAIFSGSSKELYVIDVFSSFKFNPTVLSSPKLILFKEKLNNFILFDLKQKNTEEIFFLGLNINGSLKLYKNWEMIFERSFFNKNNIKEKIDYQTLDIILRENLILITAVIVTEEKVKNPIIFCLNASDGSVMWNISLSTDEHITSKINTRDTLEFRSEVFRHWKLKLIQHHKDLNHLKQKTNHVDLLNSYPIYFSGKNEVNLLKSEKRLKGYYKNRIGKNINEYNYNSILVLHSYGLSLLDIHTGSLLALEKIELDPHSTYALWPANDHHEREIIFEIKFLSKLDHYSKDHQDINHAQDDLPPGTDSINHKVHCNLVFRKIDPDSSAMYETQSSFVGHLCDPISYMDYPRFGDKSWLEDPRKSVAPLVTKNHAAPSGLWGRLYHLIGRKLIDTNSKDVICISSDGLMTSFSSHGHQNWRTNAQIGWLHISRMVKMTGFSNVDSSTKHVYEHYFQPSLTELTMSYLNQTIRAVLSLGFDSISVVDLSDGYLLASHSLPCTPVAKPEVIGVHYQGMLSMSGDIVFVVKCENMVIGFSMTHYIPWVYFITLCLLMLLTILFLIWSLDPKNSYFGEFWS